MKIAVLLTTYNRKQKTIACLESLCMQQLPPGFAMDIHLTDDNSADGTAQAVRQQFPAVYVYQGTGDLFWAGGMRHTWQRAMRHQPDFYLLLNDDTMLHPQAVSTLLRTSMEQETPSLCIGSTCDDSGNLSYGGWKLSSALFWKSRMVHDNAKQVDCDFGNANILLVPKQVAERIGILSDRFTHSLADFDYTLRAKKAGFRLSVPAGFLGSCINDHKKNWLSKKTLRQRLTYLKSAKGLAYREYLHFIQSHFPLSYPGAFCKLWLKTFFPFIWDAFKKA